MNIRKIRIRLACLVLALASLAPLDAAEPAPGPTNFLSPDAVVREVLTRHPALLAARANWEAMKARIPQARAWEDPKFGLDIERSGTVRPDKFTDNEWMVSQALPLTGKNRLRARAAVAEAAAAFEEVRRRELDLAARARTAWFRLANAHTQLELNSRTEALLRQTVGNSRLKYEAGTRMQADVFMAETELAKNQEARRDLDQSLSEQQSQLNVLMNRPPGNTLERPVLPAAPEFDLDLERMQAMALAHRPELQSAQRQIEAAQARLDLARRERIPDPELRVEARQFKGGGGSFQEFDTGIFISLPWLNGAKYRAALEEARKMTESAEHERAALRAETQGMVRDQWKRIETLHHHYELFRTRILPLARQTVAATQIAYAADKATLLELLTTSRTLRETEAMEQDHLTDYLAGRAELEAMIGHAPGGGASKETTFAK